MSRIENDFLGDLEVPDDCYYGVQTLRGKQNFHITEMPMSQEPFFVIAFGYVKKAAAMANKELGTIPANVADALIYATEIREGAQVMTGDLHFKGLKDTIFLEH